MSKSVVGAQGLDDVRVRQLLDEARERLRQYVTPTEYPRLFDNVQPAQGSAHPPQSPMTAPYVSICFA